MANDRMSDDELKETYGLRNEGKSANILFEPQEMGYRCPKGHGSGEGITWSEFKEHIWCYRCEKDYHYAKDCVLVEDGFNPKDMPEQPRIIKGLKNWSEDGNDTPDIPPELLE